MEQQMQLCQSCGMPMAGQIYGTEKDGSASTDYCSYCYENGRFTADVDMDGMIEFCVQPMTESGSLTPEQAREMMNKFFPQLKRWKA